MKSYDLMKTNPVLAYQIGAVQKRGARNKLERFQATSNLMKGANHTPNVLGAIVESLILNSLMKKARKEEKYNTKAADLVINKHNDIAYNERRQAQEALERMAQAKEDRAERRDLAKEKRSEARDLKKAERDFLLELAKENRSESRGLSKEHREETQESKKFVRNTAQHRKERQFDEFLKMIKNPADRFEFAQDPSKVELEQYDERAFLPKVFGKIKAGLGITEDNPKLALRKKR
jgi:hypothetical protein